MARNLGQLTLDLILKLGGFEQSSSKAKRQLQGFAADVNKSMASVTKAVAGFGAAFGVGLGLREVIQATAEAEKSFALLQNAVENNAGAAGKTAEELAGIATALQHVSTFSDEAIQDAQALLLTFRSIRGDNFDRATQAVLDLATKLGTDLSTAAQQVGRALEDPSKGLGRLARQIGDLSPAQKRLVKDLVDVGKAAEAQGIILGVLEDKTRGFALAARQNFAGALTGLKNDLENLLEADGGVPAATEAVNDLAKALQNPEIKQGADALIAAFFRLGAAAVTGAAEAANGFNAIADTLETLNVLATRGVPGIEIPVDISAEGIEAELKRLQDRIALNERTTRLLIPTELQELETAELKRRVAELQKLKVTIPVEFTSLAGTLGLPEPPPVAGLSETQEDELDQLLDRAKDTRQKVQEQIDLLNLALAKGKFVGIEGLKEYAKAYDFLRAQLNKPLKAPTLTEAQQAIKAAGESVEKFIEQLEEQAATFDQGQAASLRYAVTQGEVGKALDLLGAKGEEARQRILDLIAAQDRDVAIDGIEDQIAAFEEEAATINLTEAALVEYQIAHGATADALARTGDRQAELTQRLRDSAAAAREAREELERRAEGKRLFEDTRTDAERFIIEVKRLGELLDSQDVTLDTYGRSVARSVAAMHDGGSAAKNYRDQLAELDKLLASGVIPNERAHAEAVAEAARIREEAHQEEIKAFTEEAMKASQQAMADFLFDPFAEGVEGMVQGFADALRRIAANIVAQDLAEKLFEGFESGFEELKGLFSGGGGLGAPTPGIAGPIQTSLEGFDPRQAALPDLGGAAVASALTAAGTATATALTTAGTASATALTGAGTATATAFTTAVTASTTALTAAGTAVAAAITAAGTAAAAAIAAAAGAGSTVSGVGGLLSNFVGPRELGGFIPPGKTALVGDSRSGRAAPELLIAGRAQPSHTRAAFMASLPGGARSAVGFAPRPALGRPQLVGLSRDGRQAPQLAFGGPTGVTVVSSRELRELERIREQERQQELRERTFETDASRYDTRERQSIERTAERDHRTEATLDRLRERATDTRSLRDVERIIGREPPASVAVPGAASLARAFDQRYTLRESAAHHRVERLAWESETLRNRDVRASVLRERFLASREAHRVDHLLERRLPAEATRAAITPPVLGLAQPDTERDTFREYLTERLSSAITLREARSVERLLDPRDHELLIGGRAAAHTLTVPAALPAVARPSISFASPLVISPLELREIEQSREFERRRELHERSAVLEQRLRERVERATERDRSSSATHDHLAERFTAATRTQQEIERLVERSATATTQRTAREVERQLERRTEANRTRVEIDRLRAVFERASRDSATIRRDTDRATEYRITDRYSGPTERTITNPVPPAAVREFERLRERATDTREIDRSQREVNRQALVERFRDSAITERERQILMPSVAPILPSVQSVISRVAAAPQAAAREFPSVFGDLVQVQSGATPRAGEFRIAVEQAQAPSIALGTAGGSVTIQPLREWLRERETERQSEASRLVERALERTVSAHEARHFERVLAGRPTAVAALGATVAPHAAPSAGSPTWTFRPEFTATAAVPDVTVTVPGAPVLGGPADGERFREWLRERDTERHFASRVERLTEGSTRERWQAWHAQTTERSDRRTSTREQIRHEREIDRTLERILEGSASSTVLSEFHSLLAVAPAATVERVREWLREVERERLVFAPAFAGRFERGGFIPPGQVGLVGDSRSGRAAPEIVLRGRRLEREEDFLTTTMSLVAPSHAPQIVGRSPDGRERPQLAYGGATGVTVIPLQRFAGAFEAGGFIPPGSFGMVGDSRFGRAAPELLMAGRVSNTVTDNNSENLTINQHFHLTAPAGTVSRQTELQVMAAAARGAANGKRRNG